jgi:hypothetical protein
MYNVYIILFYRYVEKNLVLNSLIIDYNFLKGDSYNGLKIQVMYFYLTSCLS